MPHVIAQTLSALQIPTFPCHSNKKPATPNGHHDATVQLGTYWPSDVIGLPIIPGVVVLDVDAYKGMTTQKIDQEHSIDVLTVVDNAGKVDLTAMMTELARRDINEVMVEAGPVLNGALLSEQLIDELVIYMAPKLMGNGANGLFHLPDIKTMAQNVELQITDISAVGRDWRITAKPQ